MSELPLFFLSYQVVLYALKLVPQCMCLETWIFMSYGLEEMKIKENIKYWYGTSLLGGMLVGRGGWSINNVGVSGVVDVELHLSILLWQVFVEGRARQKNIEKGTKFDMSSIQHGVWQAILVLSSSQPTLSSLIAYG